MFIARQPAIVLASCALAAATLVPTAAQTVAFYPIADVRPGMVAVGRTVFADGKLEEFRANIIGVLRNTIGPQHDLVLARLEGGPLAQTGVMQGMSGSPVYIDGKLLGAVSYQLGSFPREPIAGITPISEMIDAVDGGTGRVAPRGLSLEWPATEASVFDALRRVAAYAAAPLSLSNRDLRVVGPAGLAELAPSLRPIGSAMIVSGLDANVERRLADMIGDARRRGDDAQPTSSQALPPLRPGDAVGMSLLRGDIEMGATGTVTHIDGSKVYAFGHPFLSLGTTQLAMTQSHVYTVLPSLDTSMKIASLGPVIGVMGQDRATAVGGRLGAGPPELKISIAMGSSRGGPDRRFTYYALHDSQLTPLFAFVAILNTLVSYERQNGELSLAARGSVTFGAEGRVELDDFFAGDGVVSAAAGALTAAIGAAASNEFRPVLPTALDLELRGAERHDWTTIERAWLDTGRPRAGATHTLHVQLRRYRGDVETMSFPVTMPAKAAGPLKLLVSDGATLTALERQEIRPGRATSWPALLDQLRAARANNRVYVRLMSASAGTVVGGETLPGLPQSVRSALEADGTVALSPVPRTVIGAWERRLDRAVRGSREITITLGPPN